MRRNSILVLILSLAVVGVVVASGPGGAAQAQDASPAASDAGSPPIAVMELAPGVAVEVFAGVPSSRATGQTV